MFSSYLLLAIILVRFHASAQTAEKSLLDFFLSPCKCRCGVPNREARFFGGEFLRVHELPWVALIQTQKDGKPENSKTVPGTLINNKYIISGAAPLMGLTPYFVKVTLGAYNKCIPDVTSSNVSIEEIIIHPDFSIENHANDIALLKLSTPVLFERRISPICLAVPIHVMKLKFSLTSTTYSGRVGTIVGWSKDLETATPSCRPKKLHLPILNSGECLNTNPTSQSFTADKGCIGLIGTNSIICEEDAGTPVMYRTYSGVYELIGILTNENKCGPAERSLGFYINVNKHLSWIVHNTRDACYCIKT